MQMLVCNGNYGILWQHDESAQKALSMSSDDYALIPAPPVSLLMREMVPLDRHPAAVYLASLTSIRSQRVMEQALRAIGGLLTNTDPKTVNILALDWAVLRYQHTAAVRARLAAESSVATANRLLSALRGVLKEAWRLGLMSAEDYQRAIDIANIKGETVPAGRELSQGELMALVQACKKDHSPAGVRDAAILGLLYTCGLRRAELVGLDQSDFDSDTGQLIVRVGKGRKGRTVYVTGGAHHALTAWLIVCGSSGGALFLPIQKGGKITERRMNAQSIYDMLRKRGMQAGVKAFSPHDLRRTFVGDMLECGVDISTVASIAGHASVDTTRRYDRRPEAIKKTAAGKLHFPY